MTLSNASPSLSSYRRRKYDAMVQDILEVSRAIMREQGVAALSIQEIARRMDLRAPSLYHYFAGKMEIYDALFRHGFALFGEHMDLQHADDLSWTDFVRSSFEGYLSFAKENPDLYQLCFERPVPGFVPSPESLQASLELLDKAYRRAADFSGEIHSDLNPEQTVDLVIAMMHGIAALHLANEPDLPVGAGRFGSLIPAAVKLLEKAWLTG